MKTWHLRAAACAALVLAVTIEGGCWGRKFFRMPSATLDSSTKIDSLLAENALLRERISAIEQTLRQSEERSRAANADLRTDLDELKDQLNTIQELIRETTESSPFTPTERKKPARADTTRARPPSASGSEALAPGGPQGGAVPSGAPGDTLARLAGAVDTAGAAGAPAPPPEELFRQIYRDYSRGEYALALEESESFFDEYPDDPLGEDVLFIRGECLMAQASYSDALKEFSTLLQRSPRGKRAPGALLRMAVAYDSMGQKELAAGVVRRLLKDFPRSEEAKTAQEQFAGILKE